MDYVIGHHNKHYGLFPTVIYSITYNRRQNYLKHKKHLKHQKLKHLEYVINRKKKILAKKEHRLEILKANLKETKEDRKKKN